MYLSATYGEAIILQCFFFNFYRLSTFKEAERKL